MNSKSKFEEKEEERLADAQKVAMTRQILAEKIHRQIRHYQIRKLIAEDRISDMQRIMRDNADQYELMSEWKHSLKTYQEEVELCRRQIEAYKTGNEKAKLIPDRLL